VAYLVLVLKPQVAQDVPLPLVPCWVWVEWAEPLPVVLVALRALAPTMALCLNSDR
jgi:hypothetical protein